MSYISNDVDVCIGLQQHFHHLQVALASSYMQRSDSILQSQEKT